MLAFSDEETSRPLLLLSPFFDTSPLQNKSTVARYTHTHFLSTFLVVEEVWNSIHQSSHIKFILNLND